MNDPLDIYLDEATAPLRGDEELRLEVDTETEPGAAKAPPGSLGIDLSSGGPAGRGRATRDT